MPRLTDEQLDELMRLYQYSTPGPWERVRYGVMGPSSSETINGPDAVFTVRQHLSSAYSDRPLEDDVANLDFVVAAHRDVPELVEDLREAKASVGALRSALFEFLLADSASSSGSASGGEWTTLVVKSALVHQVRAIYADTGEPHTAG